MPFTTENIEALMCFLCIVPKPLTLYTHQCGMGKKNKVVKQTDQIYHSGQKERQEHQRNRGRYKVGPVLCETCLDALDENQDAPKHSGLYMYVT